MPKFRQKHSIVSATQWFKPGDHPAVFATEIPQIKRRGLRRTSPVRPGDWIVEETPGNYTVYDPTTFAELFEPAGDAPADEHARLLAACRLALPALQEAANRASTQEEGKRLYEVYLTVRNAIVLVGEKPENKETDHA